MSCGPPPGWQTDRKVMKTPHPHSVFAFSATPRLNSTLPVNNFLHVFYAQGGASKRNHAQVSANRGNALSRSTVPAKTHVISLPCFRNLHSTSVPIGVHPWLGTPLRLRVAAPVLVPKCRAPRLSHPCPEIFPTFLAVSFHQEPPEAARNRHSSALPDFPLKPMLYLLRMNFTFEPASIRVGVCTLARYASVLLASPLRALRRSSAARGLFMPSTIGRQPATILSNRSVTNSNRLVTNRR